MEHNIIIAGFGGQGILFLGKVIAGAALIQDKNVSWLPSYGPEMRGGTANCSVCISDQEIGDPLVTKPDILIVMNRPSFDKFIGSASKNSVVLVDSSLIDKKAERQDIQDFYVPASQLANENGLSKLGNIILLGTLAKATKMFEKEIFYEAIEQAVPSSRQQLVKTNKQAFEIGYDFIA
ncbi:MAG: 2-oxoglutarate ferredoxin oxidoreductase, gamma subunit [Oscillospiraceae bacterium]|nr:2-oxoglutarate ferredoxin oxidoreductase, gamma subunit [Oscillospiraceae bacterium]